MEITIDKNGKSLGKYSNEDISNILNALSELENIAELKRSTSKNEAEQTTTEYINFRLNGNNIKIRFSDHTRKSFANEILLGVDVDFIRKYFLIDASLGKYSEGDIITIVKNIDRNINQFSTEKAKDRLNAYVEKQLADDDYCEGLGVEDLVFSITKDYMSLKQISDDRFGIPFQVIRSLVYKNLNK